MSFPRILIVDVQHNNETVNIEDLTSLGIGQLIYECGQLLEELKDATEKAVEKEETEDDNYDIQSI